MRLRACSGLQIYSKYQMLPFEMSSCCSCDVFRQYFTMKRVKCSATVPLFCSNYQNNSILSPGFLSQQFNNLQKAELLTSFWGHRFNDKILSKYGQQQLLMVNYACGFNQSETGKYFEWIINNITGWGFSWVKTWRPETLITCIQAPLYKYPLTADASLLWTVCFVPGERKPLHYL